MAEMQSQSMPKLSAIEMEDFRIPGREAFATIALSPGANLIIHGSEHYFVDTEHIQSRKDLKTFIKQATSLTEKELDSSKLTPGSPKLVIVSGAALRVADVVRCVAVRLPWTG